MGSAIFVVIVFNAVFVIILLLLLLLLLIILLIILLPIIVLLLIIVGGGLNNLLLLLLLLLSCSRLLFFDLSFHELFVEAFFLYNRRLLLSCGGKGLLFLLLILLVLILLLMILLLILLSATQRHPHTFTFQGQFVELVAHRGCTRDRRRANRGACHFHRLSIATFLRLWVSLPEGLGLQVSKLFNIIVVVVGGLGVLNSVRFSLFDIVRIICVHLDGLATLPVCQLGFYRLNYRRHVLLPLRPVTLNETNDVFRLNFGILQESEGCLCCSCEWIPIGGDTPFFSAWF